MGAFLSGVSRYKQAFGSGTPNRLLVRERICCCSSCLDGSFEECELKVPILEYLGIK